MLLLNSNHNVTRERVCYWINKKLNWSEREFVNRDLTT